MNRGMAYCVVNGCRLVVRFWGRVIDRGSVVNRLNRAISWGGGVTIHWGISFSISFSQNCCHCYRDKNLKS